MGLSKRKIDYKKVIFRVALCLIGSFLLAFGTGVFLTPANVVAGGISGLGIIINHFVQLSRPDIYVIDIVVWGFNIIFFIVSFFCLGKRFTLHTLIATFAFPAFLTLITRTKCFAFLSDEFINLTEANGWRLIIAGIFGGLFVGTGVAITFLGDGSTGGTDVLCFVVAKYTPIKQSVTSFAVDASVIIIGMIAIRNNMVPSLVGILSALITALMIQVIFVQSNTTYIADIITDKYIELSNYIIKDLDRTATLIDARGAYDGNKDVKMLRLVIDRRDFVAFKDKIAEFDPKAFVTVNNAKQVLGEGFSALYKKRERFVKKK